MLSGGLRLTSASRPSTSLLMVSDPRSEDKIDSNRGNSWRLELGIPPAKTKTLADCWAHTYDMGDAAPVECLSFRTVIEGLGSTSVSTLDNPNALPMRDWVCYRIPCRPSEGTKARTSRYLSLAPWPQAAIFIFPRHVCNVHSCRQPMPAWHDGRVERAAL